MSLREQFKDLAKEAAEEQRTRIATVKANDDALVNDKQNILSAERIISELTDKVKELSRLHNWQHRSYLQLDVMKLSFSDHRNSREYSKFFIGFQEEGTYYTDPSNLRGVAQIVYNKLASEYLDVYIVRSGFRMGTNDSGFSIYLNVREN